MASGDEDSLLANRDFHRAGAVGAGRHAGAVPGRLHSVHAVDDRPHLLLGIVAKNAILLLDYILITRREHHLDRSTAILDACRKRARPIIKTIVAMGGGMLPVALGLGGDPSFRVPMAIVGISGLITSTLLSLLVVPVVYGGVDDGVRGRVERQRGVR